MAARKHRRNIRCNGPVKATNAPAPKQLNWSDVRLIARRDIGQKHIADTV